MIYVPEIIGEIIDTLRDSGTYTSASQNGNQWTLTADHNLTVGNWVVILDTSGGGTNVFEMIFPIIFSDDVNGLIDADADALGDFKVIAVTDTTFTIESSITIPTDGEYKGLNPYYIFGHRREINKRLLEKQGKKSKFQKYPLIALRLPITESVSDSIHEVNLNMAVMEYTNENYHAQDRYDKVIHPILGPIYFDFLDAIKDSGKINNVSNPDHTRIDRLYWGTEETNGNVSNIFSDPLDAIEIQDLNLFIIDDKCNGSM